MFDLIGLLKAQGGVFQGYFRSSTCENWESGTRLNDDSVFCHLQWLIV
jgi:hypothetical protein